MAQLCGSQISVLINSPLCKVATEKFSIVPFERCSDFCCYIYFFSSIFSIAFLPTLFTYHHASFKMLSSHLSHITALALSLPTLILATCNSTQTCKITPADASWPSSADWTAFNTSISGTLIKTLPPASSCYTGNPFNSTQNCSSVQTNWNLATWQAETPEGIDYPIYANNSCLPTDATGYQDGKGCDIGGSPIYVVNATTEDHVSTAMKWATERNIRVVIKGTGHDLNGRFDPPFPDLSNPT